MQGTAYRCWSWQECCACMCMLCACLTHGAWQCIWARARASIQHMCLTDRALVTQDMLNAAPPQSTADCQHAPGRYPQCIEFGKYEIDTWYSSPYPQEYARYVRADEMPHVASCHSYSSGRCDFTVVKLSVLNCSVTNNHSYVMNCRS